MVDPTADVRIEGSGNIIVRAVGSGINVAIDLNVAHLRLTRFEARTKLAGLDKSDAALLSAYRSDIVPLLGREDTLAGLWDWLSRDQPVALRVVIGAGGRGKTRLAFELARQATEKKWLAGVVEQRELDRFRKQHNVADWRWDKPTLVVIDYAASRADQLRDWLGELVDAAIEDGRPPLRMLLLERQAQREIGWLASVFGLGADDCSRAAIALLDPPEPIELPAIDDLAFRWQIFAALLARKRPGATAPELGADREFDRLLGAEKWAGDPLFLMMAGLVAGELGVKGALSLSRADLATKVAQRELDRIGAIAVSAGVDVGGEWPGLLARHVAVLATLSQGLSLAEARELIAAEKIRLGSAADVNRTLRALCNAIAAGSEGREIAPILPDVIGEASLLIWLGDAGVLKRLGMEGQSCVDRMAESALDRVSEVVVRTAQDFAAAGSEEPVRWLAALSSSADLGALMQISNRLPAQTLALRELGAEVAQRIVDGLRPLISRYVESGEEQTHASETALSFLAVSLHNLGNRLSALGRREEALSTTQEAADIRRRLAAARPEAFLPYLAASLNNLGAMLSDLGRREEALAATQEAADIYRRLAAARPDAFRTYLAMSLQNLGNRLSNLGRREEALAAVQEAADIYRRLAAARPDAFLDLATLLSNLGNRLSELGRRKEALAAAQEAVDIRRRLAAARPDAFLPDLATSLNNLGARLSDLGRREEALAAAQEAVDIRRRLAAARPDAFLPDLATSLNNLGNGLSDLGRGEEALAAAQGALDIRRRLAAARPDAFLPDLATSLNNLGNRLSEVGRREEALAAAQEAADSFRRLVATRPDTFLPDLAGSLNNLGNRLSDLGRREEALAATQEGIQLLRPLFLRHPHAFASRMVILCRTYLGLCEAAKREPDETLLAPIAKALQRMERESDSDGPEPA